MNWKYMLLGGVLLSASIIGFVLTDRALTPYREYEFNSSDVPPDVQLEIETLGAIQLALLAVGAAGLSIVPYSLFRSRSTSQKPDVA